ncbi:MAG: hypothetical protein AB1465_04290 [Patescibacteria group bacterium]
MLTCNFDFFEKSSITSFCKNYVFTNKDKPHLGTLFLILQINTERALAQKISEILSEILKHEYFRKEENIATNFEFALSRANQTMSALAEEGHIEWLNKFHALIAVIYDNQIHLTTTGKTLACLFRGKETINITEGLTSQKSPSIMKTFVNIISGNLKDDDKLLFATPHVLEYFSWEKIKRIIQKPTVIQAKKDFLSDISNEFEPMSFIILKINEKKLFFEKTPARPHTITPSITLPKPLLSQKTAEILPRQISAKSGLTKIKEIMSKNLKEMQNFTRSLLNKINPKKEIDQTQKTSPVKFRLASGEKSTFFLNLIKILKEIYISFLQKFRHLAPLSRVLLIVALLFIITLTINITRASLKQKDKKLNLQYEKALSLAQEKEKQASNALIYNDYEKAGKLLLETKEIAEKDLLPSKKYKEEGEKLLLKIQENLDKTNKVIRVKDVKTLVDLEAAKIETRNIIAVNDAIFVFDSKKTTLYKFDEKAKKFSLFAKNDELKEVMLLAANETKNTILFLTKKLNLYEFIIETKNFQTSDITFANESALPQDMQSYAERLYFLVPSDNQLWRHQRIISGYTPGVEWFLDKKNLDIKNAASFAIDGSVYILKANGEVLKFLNAEKEEFTMPKLTIPLSSPTKIITNIDSEFIYILDPKEKRVIVLDKKGSLKNQYISDEFSELQGIYVKEKDKKMYLLTDKKLLEVKLEK